MRGQKGAGTPVAIGSLTGPVLRQNRNRSRARSGPCHHRVDDARAVLGIINALRFASTRPMAGPSGIDDACARHDLGYHAMAGFLMARASSASQARGLLTRDLRRRILMYRLCAGIGTSSASHPVHAERVSSRRPQGTIQAHPPQHRVRLLRRHAARESAHLARDQADSLRRVVSKIRRR